MEHTFEATLVRQCAPTLAGLKPGSLFCFQASDLALCRRKAAQWDERLSPLGLAVRVLLERTDQGAAIVYVYRRSQLEQALSAPRCRAFLAGMGYGRGGTEELLGQLSDRLRTEPEFPHEIGVFLGYPLRDVVGFIENRGRNFTCCGLWKSYSDPAEIQKCFDCYRRCVARYLRLFEQGVPIERLAVAA